MLNLEWLRTFKTIYEKKSITLAAEALFISQPGASLHLSSLESHVGYKLFERRPRKLIVTERGKMLYNVIFDPISQLEEIEQNYKKTTRENIPTITVGMCFETFQTTIEKHLSRLDFNLIAEFGEYKELLTKLGQGVVDIVVTPQIVEDKNIEYTPFSQENIILVAGKGTDIIPFEDALLSGDKQQVLKWFSQQVWYGVAGDNEHLHSFWKRNFNAHPSFRPNYIVPNLHSIIRSLSVSEGLAVIPDFLCRKELDDGFVTELWQGYKPLSNELYFAVGKNCTQSKHIMKLEEYLKKEMPPFRNV